jgi:1,3-beta-galactosyl-N-acetylhexosamine phosphorylase
MAAAKSYGQGRAVFFGALPYDLTNSRLLHRALFWAAGQEQELKKWFCSNPLTDCAWYPESGKLVVVNNSDQPQATTVYRGDGKTTKVTLQPYASKWLGR